LNRPKEVKWYKYQLLYILLLWVLGDRPSCHTFAHAPNRTGSGRVLVRDVRPRPADTNAALFNRLRDLPYFGSYFLLIVILSISKYKLREYSSGVRPPGARPQRIWTKEFNLRVTSERFHMY